MDTLGARLKHLRIKNKMKQIEITEKTGISTSNISRIEKDEISPSATAIMQICKLFNVSADWLLLGECEIEKERTADPVSETHLTLDEKILLNNYRDMEIKDKEELQKKAARMLSYEKNTEKKIITSQNSKEGDKLPKLFSNEKAV